MFEYKSACRSTITPTLEYILLIRFKTRKTVKERHRLEAVFILLFPLNKGETEGVKKKCTQLHARHFFSNVFGNQQNLKLATKKGSQLDPKHSYSSRHTQAQPHFSFFYPRPLIVASESRGGVVEIYPYKSDTPSGISYIICCFLLQQTAWCFYQGFKIPPSAAK